MNYFNIQPVTINTTPFETITADAIGWYVTNYYREGESALFQCKAADTTTGLGSYMWILEVPKSTLDQWLDDSVIDDYICSTSNGLFVKI